MTRVAILLCVLLALAGRAAAKDPPAIEDARLRWQQLTPEEQKEKLRLYEQRWKHLSAEERKRRMDVFEAKLAGMSPTQKAELIEKLRDVRRRNDLDDLRRRHERVTRIERRLLKDLPPELRERLARLPPEQRRQVVRHALRRLAQRTRERLLAWLSPDQRVALASASTADRLARMETLERERVLLDLLPAEREAITAMPPPQREEEVSRLIRNRREERASEARRETSRELQKMLDLPMEEADAILKLSRLGRTLADLGMDDADTRARLARVPLAQLKTLVSDIRKLKTPEERREALRAFLATH